MKFNHPNKRALLSKKSKDTVEVIRHTTEYLKLVKLTIKPDTLWCTVELTRICDMYEHSSSNENWKWQFYIFILLHLKPPYFVQNSSSFCGQPCLLFLSYIFSNNMFCLQTDKAVYFHITCFGFRQTKHTQITKEKLLCWHVSPNVANFRLCDKLRLKYGIWWKIVVFVNFLFAWGVNYYF